MVYDQTNRRAVVSDFSVPPLKLYDFLKLIPKIKNIEKTELQHGAPEV
jgi:hypothetical protein